ncbi:hypothetical protein TNCV_4575031 [Trichonephila clavipes]|nr:hypothetical protein TNCV_4575031 [Trichonephila clavipes]
MWCIVYPMAVQAITLSEETLYRYRMKAGETPSPLSLQTLIRLSEYCTLNRDLSEKTTLYHSCIKFCRFAHQSRFPSLCCIVNGSRSNGQRYDSQQCCKRRLIVRTDTGHAPNMPLS